MLNFLFLACQFLFLAINVVVNFIWHVNFSSSNYIVCKICFEIHFLFLNMVSWVHKTLRNVSFISACLSFYDIMISRSLLIKNYNLP